MAKVENQKLEFMLAKEYKEGMNIPREFKGKKYSYTKEELLKKYQNQII